jgi:uncharacterized delta-60 repeat protein
VLYRRTGLAAAAAFLALVTPAAIAAQGDLDASFSQDGKLTLPVGGDGGHAEAVTVDAKGRTLLAGAIDPAGADGEDFAVARLLPNGSADTAFSGDGIAVINASSSAGGDDAASAIAIHAGKIVVAGTASAGGGADFALVRLLASGQPDTSFGGGDGVATKDVTGADAGADLAVDSSGRYVIAGTDGANDFAVVRFSSAGAPDTGFSSDGVISVNVDSTPSDDAAEAVATDSQGRVVVAGRTSPAGSVDPADRNTAVARLTTAGDLDLNFNSAGSIDGRAIFDLSGTQLEDGARAVAIGGKDRPILAGVAKQGDELDGVVARLTLGGSPDIKFSQDGKAFADLAGDDEVEEVAIDKIKRILLGGTYRPATGDSEFELARFKADGATDTAFSTDGVATADLAAGDDRGLAVALDPRSGRIAMAGVNLPSADPASPAAARFEGVERCGNRLPTIIGDNGTNNLKGTKRKDVISLGGSKDIVRGRGRGDVICGGAGGDQIQGGKGADRLLGGKGRDVIYGGPGKDRIKGGKGKDFVKKGSA